MRIKELILTLIATLTFLNVAYANKLAEKRLELCSKIAALKLDSEDSQVRRWDYMVDQGDINEIVSPLSKNEFEQLPWKLTDEVKDDVRRQIIQGHLNFLTQKQPEGFFDKLSQRWFCSGLSNTWRSFEEIYPQDFNKVSMPDSIEEVKNDFKFSIELLSSFSFYKYIYEYQIRYYLWQTTTGGVETDPTDMMLQKNQSLEEKSKGPRAVDKVGRKFVCPPMVDLHNDQETQYLFRFYEEMFNISGVIAINTTDNEVTYLSGPFLPSYNYSQKISEFSFPNFGTFKAEYADHFPINDGIHYIWEEKQKEGKIPEDFYIRNMNGLNVYTGILARNFLPIGRDGIIEGLLRKFQKYENGYFYYRFLGRSRRSLRDGNACKYKSYDHSYDLPSGERVLHFISGLPCNNYDGRIVTELHIRINPEKGDVEFKIAETKNLGNVPECSEKY